MPRRKTTSLLTLRPVARTAPLPGDGTERIRLFDKTRIAASMFYGPEIYRMVGFLRKTLNDFTGHGVKQLLKEDPNLVLAVKLKTAGGRRELEVQCRVLAGESASVIAVEVGSTKSIIETYCTFFFDVPGRLDQIGYIRHRVTKVPINGQASVESLAKLSCYNNGPAVVPAWLDYLDHIGEAHDLSTELGRQRETIELYTQAMNLELFPPGPAVSSNGQPSSTM